MNATREQLMQALGEMWGRYPEWRLGQMICNLAAWARQPAGPEGAAGDLWDIEDEELLAAIRQHFARRAEHERTGHWPAEETRT